MCDVIYTSIICLHWNRLTKSYKKNLLHYTAGQNILLLHTRNESLRLINLANVFCVWFAKRVLWMNACGWEEGEMIKDENEAIATSSGKSSQVSARPPSRNQVNNQNRDRDEEWEWKLKISILFDSYTDVLCY